MNVNRKDVHASGKNYMMSRFSDFVVCSTNHYIWSSGVYI